MTSIHDAGKQAITHIFDNKTNKYTKLIKLLPFCKFTFQNKTNQHNTMGKIVKNATMWKFSEDSIMPFGKHKGKTIIQIFSEEPSYIKFCLRNIRKFSITDECMKEFLKLNKIFIYKDNNFFGDFINKKFEVYRIFRENTIYDNGKNKPISSFSNTILCFEKDKQVIKTTYHLCSNTVKDSAGNQVTVTKNYSLAELTPHIPKEERSNIIGFSIRAVDYKDLIAYRKYAYNYYSSRTRVFEIAKYLPCGFVVLVISIDFSNFRQTEVEFNHWLDFHYQEILVMPPNSECVMHLVNKHYTRKIEIGKRKRTPEEVETLAEERQKSADDFIKTHYDYLIKENGCVPKNIYDLVGDWNGEYLEDGKWNYKKYLSEEEIPVYGMRNVLENILHTYSLSKKAFPDTNPFLTSNLSYDFDLLQFSLPAHEISLICREWYENNNLLDLYEKEQRRITSIQREQWLIDMDFYGYDE